MKAKFITIVCPILVILACKQPEPINPLQQIVDLQKDTIISLRSDILTLTKAKDSLQSELNYWFSEEEINSLKSKGIENPKDSIISAINNNPDILRYKGVLGGIMRIWNAQPLGDRWAIADFSDGHIDGVMLLKYEVHKGSSIKWRVLDDYIK